MTLKYVSDAYSTTDKMTGVGGGEGQVVHIHTVSGRTDTEILVELSINLHT